MPDTLCPWCHPEGPEDPHCISCRLGIETTIPGTHARPCIDHEGATSYFCDECVLYYDAEYGAGE